MKLRTASLIRSAQNLRDMAHELKLLLTLSDEVETARGRDIEARTVREEVEGLRARVGQEVVGLLRDKDGERET